MASHQRTSTTGRDRTRHQVSSVLADAAIARRASGLSQLDVARGSGMSRSQVGRLLRDEVRYPTADQVGRLCAAVGLQLRLRAFPGGDPIRDAGHTALLARFRADIHPSLRWRTEVPLPIEGDPRAWDATVTDAAGCVAVEAETRLADIQATQRKIALKQRDGGLERVVLVIADTRANRLAFSSAEPALRTQFPLGPRAVLPALRSGCLPDASGWVFR